MLSSIPQVRSLARALQPGMVSTRRSLHMYPATGFLEMRTSAIISERLHALGYEVLTGREVLDAEMRLGVPDAAVLEEHAKAVLTQEGTPCSYLTGDMKEGITGVIGILRCGEGPVTALRFDIDALGMTERTDPDHRPFREGFSSRNPGMMHACGHDGHTAIGLGVAEILMQLRDSLHGTLKLIFQPAEEGARGARALTAAGHLDDVDYFIGNHIAPTHSLDDGDVTAGTWGSLATTKYDVIFHGLAAHAGGYPEKGSNALLAAAEAVLALHAIPRHSGGQSRVNVGVLHAGTGRNVVPDRASMQVEVRGETTEINAYMAERCEAICRGAAQMQGCTVDLVKVGEAEGQHSDLPLIERIDRVLAENLPELRLSSIQNAQNWGSEDISIMMNRVQAHGGQATYMRTMTDLASAQHTVGFDFEESVLQNACEVFCAIVLDLMGESAS